MKFFFIFKKIEILFFISKKIFTDLLIIESVFKFLFFLFASWVQVNAAARTLLIIVQWLLS